MGLTLRDGVYQTRVKLGELIPNFWFDEDIIYDLNWAAQDMCSAAQYLETGVQFTWPSKPGTTIPWQEAPLRPEVDQVLAVAIYAGQLFQLNQMDSLDVQVATKVGNIPLGFYTRTGTKELIPQGSGATTGDLTVVPITNNYGQEYVTVLGLWPVPSSNYDTTVIYTKFHPFVNDPLSPIGIPARFSRGWIAYAVARAKEKETALDEAQYYQGIYDQQKQAFVDYMISRKQLRTFPQYGGTAWPSLARGSSSVIFVDQNPVLINQ